MKVLTFSVAAEAATGLVLVVAPAIAATLLLGAALDASATVVARCFGIALISLTVACWLGRAASGAGASSLRGMLVYNLLIAACLGYAGAVEHLAGALLWPAVALHAVIGLLLARDWSRERAGASRDN
jgi:hypothetical protein